MNAGSLPNHSIEINRNIINISSEESMKKVSFKVLMPWGIEKAGLNEIKLKILELPQGYSSEERVNVEATMELVHQIRIYAPYPGKYMEVKDVYIRTAEDNSEVRFTLPIFNRGKESIKDVTALVEIYGPQGELIGYTDSNPVSLNVAEEGKIEAVFHPEKRGKYRALIRVMYEGKQIELEKEFFVGSRYVSIKGVTVSDFALGDIAKFNIFVESEWNQDIKDLYADISIKDSDNNQVAKLKTSSTDLKPESMEILNAYWDTSDIEPGEYSMNVILNYANLMTEKWLEMDVGLNSIRIRSPTGAVAAAEDQQGWGISLYVIVLILIILNIIMLITLYRRIKRKL